VLIVAYHSQTMLDVLRNHVTGKALIKANLKNYRFFDNVSIDAGVRE
jgi:hypothetical protein